MFRSNRIAPIGREISRKILSPSRSTTWSPLKPNRGLADKSGNKDLDKVSEMTKPNHNSKDHSTSESKGSLAQEQHAAKIQQTVQQLKELEKGANGPPLRDAMIAGIANTLAKLKTTNPTLQNIADTQSDQHPSVTEAVKPLLAAFKPKESQENCPRPSLDEVTSFLQDKNKAILALEQALERELAEESKPEGITWQQAESWDQFELSYETSQRNQKLERRREEIIKITNNLRKLEANTKEDQSDSQIINNATIQHLDEILHRAYECELGYSREIRKTNECLKNLNEIPGQINQNLYLLPKDMDFSYIPEGAVLKGTTKATCGPTCLIMILSDKNKVFLKKAEEVVSKFSTMLPRGSTYMREYSHILKECGHPIPYEMRKHPELYRCKNPNQQAVDAVKALFKFDKDGNRIPIIIGIGRPDRSDIPLHVYVADGISNVKGFDFLDIRDPESGKAFRAKIYALLEVCTCEFLVPSVVKESNNGQKENDEEK